MSGLINQSSSHADDDIGAQPSVRFSRTKEELDIVQDSEFFIVKQIEENRIFTRRGRSGKSKRHQ